ncbi:hypothetical protein ABFK62_03080 [Acinetobacter baumannii]|uniref:hypothetical protein n=1 Tax=Acinetobacter baumannii TaxID=470 RepID=UPI0007443D85|nr:hypothetical protein [Acinetobacter baumannii]EKU0940071.1 hypothetical protein [Acinetobacter baumannii]EKX7142171.1 hypothetical protein [Acinetobacter baumannii]MBD0074763.1 hypothetical protein [Acinetobacter baumannii]MBD0154351.1 hypothetical protein [Acinetobacter baumannii]MBZ0431299.1 hypothetical protein [Acinetobacter baumannii]
MQKNSFCLIVCCFIFGSSAQAASDEKVKDCLTYEKVAAFTMEYRQKGGSLADLYKTDFGSKDRNRLVQGLAKEAFEIPRYQSEKVQQDAINNFKNEKFLNCLKYLK